MKVIASTIKSAQWQAWLSQQTSPFPIVQSGTSDHPSDSEALIIANPCTLADIEQDLLSFDEVILHVWDAKSTLADALRNGAGDKAIEETLTEWMRFTKALLAWLPNHQHKVNLISHTHATFYIEAWQGWLTSLGIEWPDAMSMAPRTQQDEYDIFAAYYISQRPEFAHLEQLLFSVTLPMGDSYPTLPFDMTSLAQQSQQVVEQLRYTNKQLTECKKEVELLRQEKANEKVKFDKHAVEIEKQLKDSKLKLHTLVQEKELVIAELYRVQEALDVSLDKSEKQTAECKSLEKSIAEQQELHSRLNKEHIARQADLRASIQKIKALEHENNFASTELNRVKELLDLSLNENKKQAERCIALEQQVSDIRHKQIYADKRYTNSQAALDASEKKKQLLVEEHELLIAELHRAQEAFGMLCEEKTILKEKTDQQAQQLKANTAKIASLSKRIRSTKLELAQALTSKTLLEKEIAAHHKSALWKVTVPVRKFRQTPKRKRAEKLAQQKMLIELSDFFDKAWYLSQYPDVEQQGLDPIDHYLRFGAQEGRNPSPDFDTRWYLKTYPDVAESGLNPLVHFIKFGNREERQTAAKLLELK